MSYYVHSDYIPEVARTYLTPGKRYRLINIDLTGFGGDFLGDSIDEQDALEDRTVSVYFASSAHLGNEAWTITDEEGQVLTPEELRLRVA